MTMLVAVLVTFNIATLVASGERSDLGAWVALGSVIIFALGILIGYATVWIVDWRDKHRKGL